MQKRFSEEQIVSILREAEKGEQTISALCRAHGITQNTFYRWRQHYCSFKVGLTDRVASA